MQTRPQAAVWNAPAYQKTVNSSSFAPDIALTVNTEFSSWSSVNSTHFKFKQKYIYNHNNVKCHSENGHRQSVNPPRIQQMSKTPPGTDYQIDRSLYFYAQSAMLHMGWNKSQFSYIG